MTSLARFYNFSLNLCNVIDDVTVWLKKSYISYFSKQQCSRLLKYSIPSITIQLNLENKQEIKNSVEHVLQNAVAMATSDPITYILLHH